MESKSHGLLPLQLDFLLMSLWDIKFKISLKKNAIPWPKCCPCTMLTSLNIILWWFIVINAIVKSLGN